MAEADVTRSSTEQPDVTMAAVGPPMTHGSTVTTWSATEQPGVIVPAVPAVTLGPTPNLEMLPQVLSTPMQWEIYVEFNNDMWWAMPHHLSDGIVDQWLRGAQQVSFVWDWGDTRKGSFQLGGAATSVNRYIIDFDTMQQRNVDNDRTRKVKVVCLLR